MSARILNIIQSGFAILLISFMIYIAFFDTGDWMPQFARRPRRAGGFRACEIISYALLRISVLLSTPENARNFHRVVSWMVLMGRCRTCRAPIAIRYPIIEAMTAAMFAAAFAYYGPGWLFASRLILGCALIVLFAIDLEHHLLPNVITLPGIVVGFALSFFTGLGWVSSLIGIAIGGGVLFAIAEAYYRLRHEEGLGMGDVKMLAMIGAFLGWPATLMTLMMGSVAGSIVGMLIIAMRRGDMKYALPFGTFLAMGAPLAATIGPEPSQLVPGLLVRQGVIVGSDRRSSAVLVAPARLAHGECFF